MLNATIIPMTAAQMSEVEFDRRRAEIRTTWGDSSSDAAARRECELALLYQETGWTLRRLAEKEGKGKSWVDYHLRFGRYLASGLSTIGGQLTERRFRKYWNMTSGDDELARFREVNRLMAEEAEHQAKPSMAIGKALRAEFTDNKWHDATTMAEAIDKPWQDVAKVLDHAAGRENRATFKVEKRQHRGAEQYRITAKAKMVSSFELTEKLRPIIAGLLTEARKGTVRISTNTILRLISELEEHLEQWTQ